MPGTPSLPGSRGHYITPWDCLSYRGATTVQPPSTTTTSVLTGWTEKSSMIASLLKMSLFWVYISEWCWLWSPPLVRAPVANVQSAGKQHNVFSQRLLKTHLWRKVNKQWDYDGFCFRPISHLLLLHSRLHLDSDDISRFLFKLKIASLTNPRMIISSEESLMVVIGIQLKEYQIWMEWREGQSDKY